MSRQVNRRLKVLVSSYACSPLRGSEPGMGWGFVEALSKHHDLWVITEEEKFRSEIEAELELRAELKEHIVFHYIRKTRWRFLRKIWPPSYYWFYRAWQKKAFTLAKQLNEEIHFDVVHQLNMVGFREPGYLWKLDMPFVWGPIGGLGVLPWRFLPVLGLYGCVYHLSKNIANMFHLRFLRRPRRAARKAAALIAATPDVQKAISRVWNRDSLVICEVGPPDGVKCEPSVRGGGQPLRLIWSGCHIPRKALGLLLNALVLLRQDVKWHLDILGAGSRTSVWKAHAQKRGIADRCTWHGWVDRAQALRIMRTGHVLVVSSLADLTSTVVLEAMSQGVPVICLDHCGFAHVIDDKCGIKIAVTSPEQVQMDIANAVTRLYEDELLRHNLAREALRKSCAFGWESKAHSMNDVYAAIACVR